MEKTALVIGGTGFLGSEIVRELLEAGWTVTGLGRGQRTMPIEGVPLITADRVKLGELEGAVGDREFDLIVDCAAYRQSDAEDAVGVFGGRVGHYIFISTDFVYAAVDDATYPTREDAPKQPQLPYAAGKLAAEAVLAAAWERKRFPATTLRPPHILGAGKPLGCDPLVMREMRLPQMIRDKEPLRLIADGQLLVQPVWNREVGRAIASIALKEQTFGEICNCAGRDCVTALRYYQIIAEALGTPLNVQSVTIAEFVKSHPDKAHIARHRIYDLTKLREIGGHVPKLRIEDAILETLRWPETAASGH